MLYKSLFKFSVKRILENVNKYQIHRFKSLQSPDILLPIAQSTAKQIENKIKANNIENEVKPSRATFKKPPAAPTTSSATKKTKSATAAAPVARKYKGKGKGKRSFVRPPNDPVLDTDEDDEEQYFEKEPDQEEEDEYDEFELSQDPEHGAY